MARMLKSLALRCLPYHWRSSLGAHRVLVKYGHLRSCRERACVDALGKPVPWYTYPAVEYLTQLDWHDRTVFEYGSGNSTVFWSLLAKRVVSVESNQEWFDRTKPRLPSHCELIYEPDQAKYVGSINEPFDVIIVDGEWRLDCAKHARGFLKPGGLMILDNADWHPHTSAFLRGSALLEVDFTGLGPINPYTWTTSLFFSRDFQVRPAYQREPWPGVGALVHLVE
jgi:hypothetical protein